MELRDLEVFLTLAEELHFRRTADRLYISTGRVSQTVQAMEKEIGGPLFFRNSRHVRATPLGEQFRDDISQAVGQLYQAIRDVRTAAKGIDQVLRLGYLASIGGPFVTALAARFEALRPRTRVSLRALSPGAGFTFLRERQIDLFLAWSPGGGGAAVGGDGRTTGPELMTDKRALLVTDDHPLASHESVSIEEVADFEILSLSGNAPAAFLDAWTPQLTPSGRVLRRVDLADPLIGSNDVLPIDLLTAVARSQAPHLSICSLLTYHNYPGLVLVPISDLPPCVLVSVWQAELETDTIRAFVETSAEQVTETAGIKSVR